MMQNKIIENMNKFNFNIKPIDMKNSVEFHCTPFLFEFLHNLILMNRDDASIVTGILYNFLKGDDQGKNNINHLLSIKSENGRMYLYLTSVVYVSDYETLNELRELEDDFFDDLEDLGFKGIIFKKYDNPGIGIINTEAEFNTKEEFINLVKVATKEVIADYVVVSEVPNIYAVQIVTSKQNFIISPHSGCYSLETLKDYIASHVNY